MATITKVTDETTGVETTNIVLTTNSDKATLHTKGTYLEKDIVIDCGGSERSSDNFNYCVTKQLAEATLNVVSIARYPGLFIPRANVPGKIITWDMYVIYDTTAYPDLDYTLLAQNNALYYADSSGHIIGNKIKTTTTKNDDGTTTIIKTPFFCEETKTWSIQNNTEESTADNVTVTNSGASVMFCLKDFPYRFHCTYEPF